MMSSRRRRGCGCVGCWFYSTPVFVLSLLALLFLVGEVIRFVVALIARPTAPSLTGVAVTLGILLSIQIGPKVYRHTQRQRHDDYTNES